MCIASGKGDCKVFVGYKNTGSLSPTKIYKKDECFLLQKIVLYLINVGSQNIERLLVVMLHDSAA